jgi:Rrf2 family protein
MIRINRQTDYAVRVLLLLARQPEGTKLSTAFVRDEMLIPSAFIPRIVARLAAEGLVNTYPGRDGGITLSRPAAQISLLNVVEAFEGKLCLSDCFDGGSTDCPFETSCPVRGRWGRVQAAMAREMSAMNFADMSRDEAVTQLKVAG